MTMMRIATGKSTLTICGKSIQKASYGHAAIRMAKNPPIVLEATTKVIQPRHGKRQVRSMLTRRTVKTMRIDHERR
jgi:hypothetical protein